MANMDAYWTPRLGDTYLSLKEYASCIDDEDVYLQSAEASLTYSKIRIEFVSCKLNPFVELCDPDEVV